MDSTPPTVQQRILDAACELFLENGYQVGMDAVAHRAGVSKQTVYAHFACKDALFRAAAQAMIAPLQAGMDPDRRDLEECLQFIGCHYLRYISEPRLVALGRMLVAQATRFPRLAQTLYQTGPEAVLERLAARFAAAMDEHRMRRDDPAAAAELFLAMLNGVDGDRRLLGVPGRGPSAQDAWVRHVVDIFLRAYVPVPPIPHHPEQRNPA